MHAEARSLDDLRRNLDRMMDRAAAEAVEHDRRATEARRRHQHLKNLRAALDRPPATGPRV